ncbi:MAG: tetratricopeptide repeat protein [Streptosporangiaceae bacterium]
MLFSDIEGSTALLSRLGDRYGEALSAQRALLRSAFSACAGKEMGTEGDSFFVVFESAADAVRCCVAAQRALAGHDWPEGAVVRVRMGLHSGEPARHDDGYVGLDVHRAARIAAAAHGGQVVLSDATRQLAESQLPGDVSVRDLGWHRLKDIDAPERIYQLAIVGLQERFLPLKSLGAPTSLPVPMTPLVGRDAELAQLQDVVLATGVRLVTLTGTGGVGKTRLAIAAAAAVDQAFEYGVYFVALAAVRDAEVMWKTIADDLDARGDGSVTAVTGCLADRRTLLVLDNLEQLDGAAEVVAELLAAVPRLVVLATSRRPLHLQGEHEFPLHPLELPRHAGVQEVTASGAARLFVQQAGMVRPGFTVTAGNAADVAAICGRLDGLPLAIELAASRVRLLTPSALLARLGHSLELASGYATAPSRQQTLRNTIAWSYDLLTPDLAGAFRRMGVFAGGCDLDALATVAVADAAPGATTDPLQVAAGLLDVSLITITEGADGEPRAGVLETIREYALERLEKAGELDSTRRRHAEYYAGVAERARAQMGRPAHLAALNRLEAEHDNLHAALAWSLDMPAVDPGQPQADEQILIGLRLAQALGLFWYQHGHGTEGRRYLERAIGLAPDDAGEPLARAAHGLGMLLRQHGDLDGAIRFLERSLAIWRGLGNRMLEATELNSLGITHRHRGDLNTARSMFEDSLTIARELGDDSLVAVRLANLANLEIEAGNLDRAAQMLREALVLYQTESYPLGVANAQKWLALASLLAGRAPEARVLLSGTFDYVVSSGDPELLANVLETSACIAAELGEALRAARLAGAASGIRATVGMPIPEPDAALLERFLGPARATIPDETWNATLAAGRALTQEQASTLLVPSGT